MEIQTFTLCRTLVYTGTGDAYDACHLAVHNFFPLNGIFPFTFPFSYHMLLRRAQRSGDEEVTIRFNLIDTDGRNVGLPCDVVAQRTFLSGHMFMTLTGQIEFSFPAAGDYRLDITADEDKFPSVYHYNIEMTLPPAG